MTHIFDSVAINRIRGLADLTKSLSWNFSSMATGNTLILTLPTGNNTLAFPATTGTLVESAFAQTLTNKTISGASNTLSNINLQASIVSTLPAGLIHNDGVTWTAKSLSAQFSYVVDVLTLVGFGALTTANLTEGSNLYYTNARFDTQLATKTTTDLAEGTNLYYTTGRFDARFDTQLATKTTDNLTEGVTNLYYTNARFDTQFALKTTTNLAEGTNLYYTTGRFDTQFALKTTTDLAEGTNLYYTTARFDTRFDTQFALKTTTNLAEGTNLYYTNARFDTQLATKTTDDVKEGVTNLYYTTARFDARFDTQFALKTTTNLAEGTNLYYTTGRFDTRFDTQFALKTTTNLAEGTNLYYTTGRFDTQFALKTTTDLAEGTNLYYTTGRFDTRFDTQLATKTTDDVKEGITNLYYTTGRFDTRFDTQFALKTTTNLAEGTNLYYTTGRFDTQFALKTTTDLAEGTNLYYTTGRFDTRFDTQFALKTTTNLAEGTNLYYTTGRFDTQFALKTTTDLAEGTNLYYTTGRFDTQFALKTTDDLKEGVTNRYFSDTLARAAITAGTGIQFTGGVITNIGVVSLAGTANQVLVGGTSGSAQTGALTLTLPQSIATASNVQFATLGLGKAAITTLDVVGNAYFRDASGIAGTGNGVEINVAGSTLSLINTSNTIGYLTAEVATLALGTNSTNSLSIRTNAVERINVSNSVVDVKNSLKIAALSGVLKATSGTVSGSATTDDLTEGVTNLYYTTARFDTRFDTQLATKTTDNLTEGVTNFYYTNARFDTRFDTQLATKTTDNLTEGVTNFYYTNARFDTQFATKFTTNLTEGTNLYYTTGRFDTRFATKTTDDLKEGVVNFYNSTARFNTQFGAKTTDDLTEGVTNLYYTNTRFNTQLATKTTDDIKEGVVNFYNSTARFNTQFGAKTTDDLTEGVTNKYFSNALTRSALSAGTGISYDNTTGVITCTVTSPTSFIGIDGTVGAPSHSFTSDTNTGMYSISPDSLGFATGGVNRLSMDTTSINTALIIRAVNGDVTTPGYGFTASTNTGMYYTTLSNELSFALAGSRLLRINVDYLESTKPVYTGGGSASVPAYTFSADTDTGMYRVGANSLGFTAGTVLVSTINTTNITNTMPILNADGLVGTPAYSFSTNSTTGLYLTTLGDIGFSVGGALKLSVTSAGVSFVSPLLSVDGTAGAPAFSFTNDTNTGIYSITGDSMGFSTAGILRLTLNTTGLTSTLPVIIGTAGSSSGELLKINGTTSPSTIGFYNSATIQGYIGTDASGAGMILNGSATSLNIQTSAAVPIIFKYNTSEVGRIRSGGLDLGVSGTSSGPLLTIHGTTLQSYIDFKNTGTRQGYIGTDASGAGMILNSDLTSLNFQTGAGIPIIFKPSAGEIMRVTTTGLGIGVTPTYILDVGNSGGSTFRLNNWFSASGDSSGGAVVGTNMYREFSTGANRFKYTNTHASIGYAGIKFDNGVTSFYGALAATTQGVEFTPTERMQIGATGLVGIGTSPMSGVQLGISTTLIYTENLTSSNTLGSFLQFTKTSGTTRTWAIGATGTVSGAGDNSFTLVDETANGGAGAFRMTVNSSGNVGIGSTSTYSGALLYVNGGIFLPAYNFYGLGGGNATGYLYGCFAKYGDGVHIGYNFYNNNTSNVITNSGGATSRISMGYGYIGIYTGATNTEPTSLGYYQDSTGNVGIGTTVPNSKLSVGTAYKQLQFTFDTTLESGVGAGLITAAEVFTANRNLYLQNNGKHVIMGVGGGYVGINAIPVAPLTVTPAAFGPCTSYVNYKLLGYDTGSASTSYGLGVDTNTLWFNSGSSFRWSASGATTMSLDASGNLELATAGSKMSVGVALPVTYAVRILSPTAVTNVYLAGLGYAILANGSVSITGGDLYVSGKVYASTILGEMLGNYFSYNIGLPDSGSAITQFTGASTIWDTTLNALGGVTCSNSTTFTVPVTGYYEVTLQGYCYYAYNVIFYIYWNSGGSSRILGSAPGTNTGFSLTTTVNVTAANTVHFGFRSQSSASGGGFSYPSCRIKYLGN